MTRVRSAAACLAVALMAGCATAPPASTPDAQPDASPSVASKADPWEALNRKIFAFNDAVDEAVLAPVARAYRAAVPQTVRQGVDNVLGNAGDAWAAVNHLLQAKPREALETGMRVGVNTMFGFFGVLDVASEMGFERQNEDFGQTLGRWGVGPGPYVVLPIIGPRTIRDTFGWAVDRRFDLAELPSERDAGYAVTALEVVHRRAGLLAVGTLLDKIALDRYVFVREAYLAKRRNDIYDGNPPEVPDDAPPEGAPPRR